MNTLEVTYADKAGRLIEGSPDKTKLDTLPVSLNVADVKALTTAQCNSLRCGDIVTKEDSTGKHAYVVTFKKDGTGMCLTYADGSGYIETVSYDFVTNAWVYNSTDVFNAEAYAKKTDITGGTLENAKPIYFHPVVTNDADTKIGFSLIILNNDPAPLDTWAKLKDYLYSVMQAIGNTARFPSTGSFVYNNEGVSCRNIDVMTNNNIRIFGYTSTGDNVYIDIQSLTIRGVYDGVNKIN